MLGLWIARGINWLAGTEGAAKVSIALCLGLALGAASWAGAGELEPYAPDERRDSVVGWSIVGSLFGLLVIVYLIASL